MANTRGQHLFLIAGFLAVIGVVGIAQAVIELSGGDPVQALELFERPPTVKHLRAYEKDLERESWFVGTLRPIVAYRRFRLLDDVGAKVLLGRDDWWFYRPGARYLTEPVPDRMDGDHGIAIAAEAIIDTRDQLDAMGIRLLVLPMPGKASVYPDRLSRRLDGALASGPTRRLIDRLEAAGVDVVNLPRLFAEARAEADARDELLFLPRDTHWTPAGVEVAVDAVAKRLGEMSVDLKPDASYERKELSVERRGDLVSMLKAPEVEAHYPPAPIRCRQVIHAATGKPFRSSNEAPILVLGDSFLRIYEHDEPGSAGFVANLAFRLHVPITAIINDGGASTLVRQQLAGRPDLLAGKHVVVWEFVERDVRFGLEGWQQIRLTPPADRATDSRESDADSSVPVAPSNP